MSAKDSPGRWPSEIVINDPIDCATSRTMYRAPWHVYLNTGHNRARIVDADGTTILSGVNEVKARVIASAVNRDDSAPDLLAALRAVVAIAVEPGADPDHFLEAIEGASAAIAKAEDR